MLKCSTSLWSADLANLVSEIRRVEPYSERFHLDVADGHYVPNLLFFPDLVRALRPHTNLPFEVHLMVTDPLAWVEPFVEAGADGIIFCYDSVPDPGAVLRRIKAEGKFAGISLSISEPLQVLDAFWEQLDLVTIIGTALGIKGASMDSSIPAKIAQGRKIISQRKLAVEIEADGGIRRETVPLLKAAGADFIVPGSLMFKEDPKTMREWLNDV
ncbi:MAG TPA: ribulose-phosphate 3-epimerase [Verrucomicrobiae bacterium]|nr:ribulose-phosphate 3-epimerase [Verrucomicrobiae bacterium]